MNKLIISCVAVWMVAGCATVATNFSEPSRPTTDALREYKLLAEQGLAEAQFNRGVMYYQGRGVTQDYAAAARWYRKAAEQGHAAAQFNLGVMYDNGRGVTQDYAEARRWYRRAYEKGRQRRAREWRPKRRAAAAPPSTGGPWVKYQKEDEEEGRPETSRPRKRKLHKYSTGSGFAVSGEGHRAPQIP